MISYDPDKASDTINNLSGMLRYALYDTNQERVPMLLELDYIKDYLDVFSVRIATEDKIVFNIDGDFSGITIAPMLFIPFIENAIKFCDRNRQECIIIHFRFIRTTVEFEAFNWKKVPCHFNSDGLGISNAKRRLQLLYPGKHTLTFEENEQHYRLKLVLDTG